ncbi:hypothetical protein HAX54_002727, partial [Datura stramonium]|nr:hypothetical protein [Datura stramonium]
RTPLVPSDEEGIIFPGGGDGSGDKSSRPPTGHCAAHQMRWWVMIDYSSFLAD